MNVKNRTREKNQRNIVGSLKRSIKSTDLQQEEWERERERFTNIRNETRTITTDPTDIKRITREYYEQLHGHKSDNIDAMD